MISRINSAVAPATVILLLAALFTSACSSREDEITKQLRDIAPGQTMPLARLFPPDVDKICLVKPYGPIAMADDGQQQPNTEYLDEGHWAFVFERNGKMESRIYRRSNDLDVTGGMSPPLPETLLLARCAARQTGVVFRFENGGRQYIELAEPKG